MTNKPDEKAAEEPPMVSGEKEVARKMEEEQEQGYVGQVPDPTPNEAYTFAGAAAGEPTPESGPK